MQIRGLIAFRQIHKSAVQLIVVDRKSHNRIRQAIKPLEVLTRKPEEVGLQMKSGHVHQRAQRIKKLFTSLNI